PDDVEADLDEILKDRIAATDEEEEDEEEVVPEPRGAVAEIAEGVTPRKANEFTCTGCFLLVNRGQFGPPGAMHCPVGEAECPAVVLIESGALDTPVAAASGGRNAGKKGSGSVAKVASAAKGRTSTAKSAKSAKSAKPSAKAAAKSTAATGSAKKSAAKKSPATKKAPVKAPVRRTKG
ncbi:MAG: DUF4193 family protein, partial [Acidimicrobiia bacterium]